MQSVKAVRDPQTPPNVDVYKSQSVHTSPGESPQSVSRPTPKGRQVAAKPITRGKLIKPGAPGGGPSKLAQQARPQPRATPQPRPMPSANTGAAAPPPTQRVSAASVPAASVAAASAAAASVPSRLTNGASNARTPSPQPPAPPVSLPQRPAKEKPTHTVLYDFGGETSSEMSLKKGDELVVLNKGDNPDGNGWWLARKAGSEQNPSGWAPSAYLTPYVAPEPQPQPVKRPPPPAPPAINGGSAASAASKKPAPPAPPAKRPQAGAKKAAPPAPPPRDSGTASQLSVPGLNGGSGNSTPRSSGGNLGGLAEALRARQQATRGGEDNDEW